MSQKDDGGTAFPAFMPEGAQSYKPGMTLREYAAIKMAAGMVADGGWADAGDWPKNVVKNAVRLADALIAELDKEETA